MAEHSNLFDNYNYRSWVPDQLRDKYPSPDSDLLEQLETEPTLDAAFAFFWATMAPTFWEDAGMSWDVWEHIFDNDPSKRPTNWEQVRLEMREIYSDKQKLFVTSLSEIVGELRPAQPPDEALKWSEVSIFIHVSSGLALLLERIENGRSERFWEVSEAALAVLKRPTIDGDWYAETNLGLDIYNSTKFVEAFLWSKQFQKQFLNRSYDRALHCLFEASKLCLDVDSELFDCFDDDCTPVDEWMTEESQRGSVFRINDEESVERYPAIRAPGACFHLVNFVIPAREAFDAFERLIEQSPDSTNWEEVAGWCRVIQAAWEDTNLNPTITSNTGTFEESARDAWVIARGLALKKISPDALVKFLERTRVSESEQRLRVYFFDQLWDLLPKAAQDALIAADLSYWATEGRRYDIFENLRIATEAVVERVLVIPFRVWLSENPRQSRARNSGEIPDEKLPLSRQIKELFDNEERFKTFAAQKYPEKAPDFWSTLNNSLQALRNIRIQAVHPEDRGNPREESISNIYRRFLGIGLPGILPELLTLLSTPQPTKSG